MHLATLSSLAIAHPIYDQLVHQTGYLTDPNVTPQALITLAALLSVGLPCGFYLLQILINRFNRRAGEEVHLVEITVLLALLLLPFACRIDWFPDWLMVVGVLLLAGMGTMAYAGFLECRRVVTACSPCVVVIPILFLTQLPLFGAPRTQWTVEKAAAEPIPVVMVVFDEFCGSSIMTPDREIDADRFPNFARLAREADWFRNASAVSPMTVSALPVILSGMRPSPVVSTANSAPQNLFSLLADGGYELSAFEPVSRMFPGSLTVTGQQASLLEQNLQLIYTVTCVYLYHISPQGFKILLPTIPGAWFSLNEDLPVDRSARRGVHRYAWSDNRRGQFEHFLDCIDETPRSAFYFGHFVLPHAPWNYLPSGNIYQVDDFKLHLSCLDPDSGVIDDQFQLIQHQQRHLLQAMFVDRLLGQLLDRLSECGILDRCLLIVTADHGISFRAGFSRRGLAEGNAADILSVPLFIKQPRQAAGQTRDQVAESVDLLPTLAGVLGIRLPSPTDGRDLFAASLIEPRELKVTLPSGEQRQFDPAILARSQVPAEIRSRFGSGTDPAALYCIGPWPEIIGRHVEELPMSDATPVAIRFTKFSDLIEPGDPALMPCLMEGALQREDSVDEPADLAVAVDGVIRATTRTYRLTGFTDRWSVMVPETEFRPGKNNISFYLITGDDQRLILCQPQS